MKSPNTNGSSMVPHLDILYQDEWIVAVDKPAGHLVHPAEEPQEGDLVAMKILRDQIGERVHTIHRLDRPTSGVLLFAVDKSAARKLHKALQIHDFDKAYWAVIQGKVTIDSWECHEPIQKDENAPSRDAHTSFRVLASRKVKALAELSTQFEGHGDVLTLVEAIPHSGRFHQIRRHLQHAGHPIVGDYRYAGIETSDTLGGLLGTGSRMMLQAKSLKLEHPMTAVNMAIEAPISPSIRRCFPEIMRDS